MVPRGNRGQTAQHGRVFLNSRLHGMSSFTSSALLVPKCELVIVITENDDGLRGGYSSFREERIVQRRIPRTRRFLGILLDLEVVRTLRKAW